MKTAPRALTAFASLLVFAGCVPAREFNQLKEQFDEQEKYVIRHRGDMRRANRENTQLAMKLRDKDYEVNRLKTENLDLAHQLESERKSPKPATPVATISKRAIENSAPQPASAAPAAATIAGFSVNPETNGIVLDQATLFKPGSATLRKDGMAVVRRIASQLNSARYRRYKARVEGHTDDTPITRSKVQDNWQLSGMRARAVLKALVKAGVAPSRLAFTGYAYYKPIVAGKTRTARARNRRVEIRLIEP